MSVYETLMNNYEPTKKRRGLFEDAAAFLQENPSPTVPGIPSSQALALDGYSPDRSGGTGGQLTRELDSTPSPTVPGVRSAADVAKAEIDKTPDDTVEWVKAANSAIRDFQNRELASKADRLQTQQDAVTQGLAMLQAIPGMNDLNQKNNFRTRGLGVMAGR